MAYVLRASTSKAGDASGVANTADIDTTTSDLLLVHLAYYGGGTVTDIIDNQIGSLLGTGSFLTAQVQGTDVSDVWFYWRPGSNVAANHHVQMTGSSVFASLQFIAFSGSVASPFDTGKESGATTASASTLAPGSRTASETNTLQVTGIGVGSASASLSINDGFTHVGADDVPHVGGTNYGSGWAYRIDTSITAANPTWTIGTTTSAATALAVFKDTPGGGGGTSWGLLIGGHLNQLVKR